LLEAPEFEESLAPGFLRIHAGAKVVFEMHLKMAFHLGGKFAFAARLTEKFSDSNKPRS
jgi:hypothetical protein